jgi:N-methylhydantoinase B/oxoprolinase/acetone carboxylase alpha subunit
LNNKIIKAKENFELKPGDILRIETAGGGGWGKAVDSDNSE